MKVCHSCKHLRDIIHTDELDRGYCSRCYVPRDQLWAYNFMALTVPFDVGDRVECRTGGIIFDGVGTVEEVSTDLNNGGTWVHPAFRVSFEEKAYDSVPDERFYTESCLKKVSEKVTTGE